MRALIKKNPAVSAMIAAGMILLSAAAVLPPAPVWITDVGNKYIIMRNFSETGKLEISHKIPEAFPTGGFHFKKTEQGYRSFYPELLPCASVLPRKLFGEYGTVFFPLLCGILLAGAVAYKFRSFTCAMLTLFATPCAFYSLMLWEMIPAVLAGFCGIMLLREKRAFAGGLVLALGLFMREELYFLGAAAGLVLLLQKQGRPLLRLSAGFLCGMLPVWLVQFLLTGHVLGVHGATYYLNNRQGFDLKEEILGVFWNYFHHLFRFEMMPVLFLPTGLLLLTGFCSREERTRKFQVFLMGAAAVLFLAGAVKFNGSASLCYAAAMSAGFITTLPFSWNFWANWKTLLCSGAQKNRLLTGIVLAYTLLVPPLLTRHDVGLFWGARHFLFVMPFVIYLSLKALPQMPCKKQLFRGLAAVSIFWQLCGLNALLRVSEESEHFTRVVKALGSQVIASDVFFLPEQTPKLFFERDFCEAATPRQLTALLKELHKRKEKEFIFITSRRWSKLEKETRQLLARYTRPGRSFEFSSRASGIMDLIVIQLHLKEHL